MKAKTYNLIRQCVEKGWNSFPLVTDAEAQEDGFKDFNEMYVWLKKKYGLDFMPVMNDYIYYLQVFFLLLLFFLDHQTLML